MSSNQVKKTAKNRLNNQRKIQKNCLKMNKLEKLNWKLKNKDLMKNQIVKSKNMKEELKV